MNKIDREGNFLATVRDHGVRPYDSGAVMFGADFDITHKWNSETEEWEDWTQYEYTAFGMFTIIQKNEKPSKLNVQSLAKAFDWYTGDPMDLQNADYSQHTVQIQVGPDTDQNGNQVFKAKFISHRDDAPYKGIKKATPEQLEQIHTKFGAQLRALMPSPPSAASGMF